MQARAIVEKRRVHRVSFDAPVHAAIAGLRVLLLDVSTNGARIEHEAPLAVRREMKLRFEHGEQTYVLSCEVVRCRLQKSVSHPGSVAYCSGLRFTASAEASRESLRSLVASLLGKRASAADSSSVASAAV